MTTPDQLELLATAFGLLEKGAATQSLDMMKRAADATRKLEEGSSGSATAVNCLETAILFTCLQDMFKQAAAGARAAQT